MFCSNIVKANNNGDEMGGSRHSVLLSHCLYVMLHHICHRGPSPPFYLSQYILSAVIIKVTGAPLYLSQSISSSRSCLLSSLWSFLVVVVLIIVFVVFNVLIVSAAYLLIHCFSSPPSPYSSASKSTPNTLASSLQHHHHHHLAHHPPPPPPSLVMGGPGRRCHAQKALCPSDCPNHLI